MFLACGPISVSSFSYWEVVVFCMRHLMRFHLFFLRGGLCLRSSGLAEQHDFLTPLGTGTYCGELAKWEVRRKRCETYNMEFSNICAMRMREKLAHRSAFVCICKDSLDIGFRFLKCAGINLQKMMNSAKKQWILKTGFRFLRAASMKCK